VYGEKVRTQDSVFSSYPSNNATAKAAVFKFTTYVRILYKATFHNWEETGELFEDLRMLALYLLQ